VKPSKLPPNQVSSYALAAAAQSSVPESLAVARAPRTPLPPIDSVFGYRINDAVAACGLSRATIYRLLKEGTLRSKLVAGRRLIEPAALRELFDAAS
jgi:hypothetical protein